MSSRTFAAIAATSPAIPVTHPIPSGSWSIYYHEPEDNSWNAESFKKIAVVSSWEMLNAVLQEIGSHKITNGLLRIMRGTTSPLWENKANVKGGSYSLKIPRRSALDVYRTYVAAAATETCAKDPANEIAGVIISPKKGSCIIKILNANAKLFNSPADINLLHGDVRESEILYTPNVERRM